MKPFNHHKYIDEARRGSRAIGLASLLTIALYVGLGWYLLS